MKLSIIIPVYNVEKYISECLDSVVQQDIDTEQYEVIIICDGSKDDSEKIAKSYCSKYSNLHLYVQKNGGLGNARNNGLKYAKGDYIYFLDSDDYIAPNILGQLINNAVNNELDVLTFNSTTFNDSSSEKFIKTPNKEEVSLSNISTGIDYIAETNYKNTVWWYLINRKFLTDLNLHFLEGRWLEDATYTLQLFLEAKRMAHLNLDSHYYRIAPGTIMTSKESAHYLKVIRDMTNAAFLFNPIIQELEHKNINPKCLHRIKTRQQSLVFFALIRIIKSDMKFDEVKKMLNEMSVKKVYPLNSFLGKDFDTLSFHFLARLLNSKSRFYIVFRLVNPFFKLKN